MFNFCWHNWSKWNDPTYDHIWRCWYQHKGCSKCGKIVERSI